METPSGADFVLQLLLDEIEGWRLELERPQEFSEHRSLLLLAEDALDRDMPDLAMSYMDSAQRIDDLYLDGHFRRRFGSIA